LPSNISTPPLDPIFVTVKEAARLLGISPWSCYQLLKSDEIDSRYIGRRRLVVLASLTEYAANAPVEKPGESA
jgi:excisionase family DNA binding protein